MASTTPDTPAHDRTRGVLAQMRIRKKLMLLHTLFSLALALILLVTIRPAIARILAHAEAEEARDLLLLLADRERGTPPGIELPQESAERGFNIRRGSAETLAVEPDELEQVLEAAGQPVILERGQFRGVAAMLAPDQPPGIESPELLLAEVQLPVVREAARGVYLLLIVAVLAIYALVVLALEVFVLPRQVYAPIRRMLSAEQAVMEGRTEEELIPESSIPADELGEIMRSRNRSIVQIRTHERALAEALAKLEQVAADLQRKNHMLERARQNLADADRLASLGMMSAGIAHELNTPLSVLKGLVERLHRAPERGVPEPDAALMLRVVKRLERLGESLLDFARARPPHSEPARLRDLAEDAITLVRLDREVGSVALVNRVPAELEIICDPDRLVQVLVNLVRNAVDALRESRAEPDRPEGGRVEVAAETISRDGEQWVCLTVADNGPGIAPEALSTIFEPFVSTRLDARGTGLGLAVAEGIIREHGGVMLARNDPVRGGAVFEAMIPASPSVPSTPGPSPDRPAENADA
ncbi:MAG: sensor histidine kinase [Phycisphaerales bacterium JB037]